MIQATLAPDSKGKTVLNSVQAISDSVDPQPQLAKDTVALVPIPAVDLELEKVAPAAPVQPGGIARFGLHVANHGPSNAPDVVVRDTLPPGLTFVSDTRGACAAAGAAITCRLGELVDGAAIDNLGIDVRVDPSLAGRTVRNTASVTSEPANAALQPAERIPSSNDAAADLVVGPVPSVPPPADCLADVLRLLDVAAGATRVHLAGETARANAGRTVRLLFRGRPVGKAVVKRNGTFATTVPLPPRRVRITNQARYRAVLGRLRSPNLKLTRQMRATGLSSRAGRVTFAGRVRGPFGRPLPRVTLRQYDCSGRSFVVVKRNIKVSRDGRFRTTVRAPKGGGVAYYRALTHVHRPGRTRRTYVTFTLLRRVALRP